MTVGGGFAFPDALYPIADADSCADVVALAQAMLAGGAHRLFHTPCAAVLAGRARAGLSPYP